VTRVLLRFAAVEAEEVMQKGVVERASRP